ncbi:uncharacterized protein LOC110024580 isoform X2 [Phalaenopsis equestris]|uniref:uncharacterized protein LOC110024580 isoform X2 n=1 Tax=Phalaenopsis equestris TaxID=78828 RepID=UPI0009E1989B|nr:uncharacterized protein LOC110024580 isoform X2 [Phalaenopsis equestris]
MEPRDLLEEIRGFLRFKVAMAPLHLTIRLKSGREFFAPLLWPELAFVTHRGYTHAIRIRPLAFTPLPSLNLIIADPASVASVATQICSAGKKIPLLPRLPHLAVDLGMPKAEPKHEEEIAGISGAGRL